jgi:hypothetical protein
MIVVPVISVRMASTIIKASIDRYQELVNFEKQILFDKKMSGQLSKCILMIMSGSVRIRKRKGKMLTF